MKVLQTALQLAIIAFLLLGGLATSNAQVLSADPTVTPANPVIGPGKTLMFSAASVSPSTFGSISSMSAGESHTCALLPNGTVECWGLNYSGELGDGTTNNSPAPVVVNGLMGATAVSAGGAHTCALLTGGTAECWGDNSWGQLGNGTNKNSPLPTPVPGLSGVVQIVAGYQDTCALMVGPSVKCWGANANSTTPVAVPAAAGGVLQFAEALAGGVGQGGIGRGHMCALYAGGVQCWGDNTYGQLGNAISTGAAVPVQNVSGAVAIAAGDAHTCALISNGSVECWGWNSWGQLGDGTTTDNIVPQVVQGLSSKAIAIAAGYDHTCALLDNGTAQCWGSEEGGSLGNGVNLTNPPYGHSTPEFVTGLSETTALVAGGAHSCALLVDGSAHCWGSGGNGELGNGSTMLSSVPSTVVLNNLAAQGATHIFTTDMALHSCVLLGSGAAQCWGNDFYGQLGDEGSSISNSPVSLSVLTGMKAISTAYFGTCALQTDGTVQCFGRNTFGELGNGSTTDSNTPVAVSNLTGVKAIASGYEFTCALRSDGSVWCWGLNASGQLGNGTFANSSTPVAASGLFGVKSIAAGYDHVCAALDDSGVKCWGGNEHGQLGNGTVNTQTGTPTPTDIFALSGITQISAGQFFTCALHIFGDPICWGENDTGEVGNGDFLDKAQPTGVASSTPAIAIASSSTHSCSLAANGTVQCWGYGGGGQLGNGTGTGSGTPIPVAGLSGVTSLAGGNSHNCVLIFNGSVECWGFGLDGEIGNGVTAQFVTPTPTLPLITPLVWTSSTPSIASIDPSSGLASTLNNGQTTITATYGSFSGSTLLTVGTAAPVITWTAPAAITYGTPLSGAQLNATASVPGTFSYNPPAGTLLGGGTQVLSVTFTPTDQSSYTTATMTVNLIVLPVTPTVTVNGGSFTYDGTPHPATAVAAYVSSNPAPGTFNFTYAPPGNATAPVAAGTYAVTANFISSSPTYTNSSGSGSITIAQAPSVTTITSNTPSPSATGQAVTVLFHVAGVTSPTGSVTVTATTSETCTGVLSAGVGSCTITFNTAGARTLTAFYPGDTNFTASNSKPSAQTVTGPVCTLSTPSINFNTVAGGNIYPGSITTKTVTVTNSGNAAMTMNGHLLSIVKGGNSNEFLEVDLCPKSLAVGKSCTIAVSFIAGPYYTAQTATLSVMDNAPGNPQTIPLSALVINPQATLSGTSLAFGTQTLNTSATKTVALKNTGTTALTPISLAVNGTNATDFTPTSNCGSSLAPGGSCTISVAFKPSAKGARSATLKITDNAQSATQAVSLTGTGR